jgi:hypothetical protein
MSNACSNAQPVAHCHHFGNKDNMKSIWPKGVAVAALSLLAGSFALFNIYPYRPRSIIGWCLLFMLALPLWFLLEFVGDRFVGARCFVSLSPVARITFGGIILGGFVSLILVTFHFPEPFVTKWGS